MTPELVSGQRDAEWVRQQIQRNDDSRFESRVKRALKTKVHPIIPHQWFEVASTECADMFRDGHFNGCICLSQSVAEALAKLVLKTHRAKGGTLIAKLKKLSTRVISGRCLQAFICIEGGDRNDFHHLNQTIITDSAILEKRAEECVMALYDIESELFAYDLTPSGLTPHQYQYWPDAGKPSGTVYLRTY